LCCWLEEGVEFCLPLGIALKRLPGVAAKPAA
jgi:hypothetical protein